MTVCVHFFVVFYLTAISAIDTLPQHLILMCLFNEFILSPFFLSLSHLIADPFEYEVVAIVANDAGINSVNDLRGSRFCHPGHGLSSHWTDILANVSVATHLLWGARARERA